MRKHWVEYKGIFALFAVWRVILAGAELIAPSIFPPNPRFLEPVRWANFDGGHYLSIASHGYGIYQQAFFPLYPMLIRVFSFLPIAPVYIALAISHISLLAGLLVLYALMKKERIQNSLWIIAFLLFFPTGFFFASAYPTSLLFFLVVSSMYASRGKNGLIAGIFGLLASATHLFGAFLFAFGLLPLGLFLYMAYLYFSVGDAFAFFHVQSAYGANRTAGEIVLLPQVLWRYGKIFLTAAHSFVYAVAAFEAIVFMLFGFLLIIAIRQKMRASYLWYSALVLIVPTLTGTFSSLPRYVLSAFPLFFVLGTVHNRAVRAILLILSIFGLVVGAMAYVSGYFIA